MFGANGPLVQPADQLHLVALCQAGVHPGPREPYAVTPQEVNVEVLRLDPAVDRIVPPNPKIFKLAEGFQFTEGPLWVKDAQGGHN